MRPFDLLPSLLRRLPALLLVGIFALMATGLVHGDCTDGDGEPERTECVVICKCACHHHLYVPNSKVTRVSFKIAPQQFIVEPTFRLPDADPSGIFRPPKHLV